MNIKQFKVGDVVTRNEPMTYKHNGSADGSYCGDYLEFLGIDQISKIIFLVDGNGVDAYELSYARDPWDEGWCLYPKSMLENIKKSLGKKMEDKLALSARPKKS